MTNIIVPGYVTEGPTDNRFLESIIQRSFERIAFDCQGEIEVFPIQKIERRPGNFIESVKMYAKEAEEKGIKILCIHVDSDDKNDRNVLDNKILPAFLAVQQDQTIALKNLIGVIPIQMSEAWMLADKNLLLEEIQTNLSEIDLGINNRPEAYDDPKEVIESAIRLARLGMPKRRRNDFTISDLYGPIGQKIDLQELAKLIYYQKFLDDIRKAYIALNYL